IFDTDYDQDGYSELVFTPYYPIYGLFFCELHLPNTWEIDSFPYVSYPILMDIGDFDLDGLPDLVLQEDFGDFPNGPPVPGISIAESPDSFSYPTQEVWRDTVGLTAVVPIVVFDVDRDGIPEIFNKNGDPQHNWIWVYESCGNNQYDTICTFTPMIGPYPHSSVSTCAFGDFDGDALIEFVMGDLGSSTTGAPYWVYESPANNTYECVAQGYVPTLNVKDCFTVPDADGDGKLEFVVKGFVVPDQKIHCFIFEATGDNTYQIIKSFTFTGGYEWYGGGYSDAGDLDGDAIPEICLEGCQNIFIIKSCGNDSFYQWQILPGHPTGSCVRVTNDLDGNGLNEIVISGNNETRIYEYVSPGIKENDLRPTPYALGFTVYPNPFKNHCVIHYALSTMHYAENGVASSQKSVVSMKIYNSAGQLVKQFNHLTIHQSPILWDGSDDSGHKLPAGVYFVSVKDGINTMTKEVIYLK
ncbi:MAG: FlgD immunoglobulin-like domain containing protein, partial [candidate division WOR-3 bacterium]